MEGNEAARQQLDESLRKGLRVPHVRVCARGPHNKLPTQPAITSCPPPPHTQTHKHTRDGRARAPRAIWGRPCGASTPSWTRGA